MWSLTADDWAILLHATEKTQVPILKRAIDLARNFFDPDNHNDDVKNHILASTVLGIINSSDTSPSKSDKIKGILSTFKTNAISLDSEIAHGNVCCFVACSSILDRQVISEAQQPQDRGKWRKSHPTTQNATLIRATGDNLNPAMGMVTQLP